MSLTAEKGSGWLEADGDGEEPSEGDGDAVMETCALTKETAVDRTRRPIAPVE